VHGVARFGYARSLLNFFGVFKAQNFARKLFEIYHKTVSRPHFFVFVEMAVLCFVYREIQDLRKEVIRDLVDGSPK